MSTAEPSQPPVATVHGAASGPRPAAAVRDSPPARRRRWITAWTPLRPDTCIRRRSATLPFPLEEPGVRLYQFARQGLWQGLAAVGLGEGDAILAPAYHHGSEIEVLVRAGLRPRWYEADAALAPEGLDALLDDDVRALYLTHYFGFGQDLVGWRRWCDERGLLLVEDAAMAWPAARDGVPLGSLGDIGIYSPWKLLGLADVGALSLRSAPPPPAPAPTARPARLRVTDHADWFAQRSATLAGVRWGRVGGASIAASEFGFTDPGAPPSRSSLRLLARMYRPDVAERRRANYAVLLDALGDRVPRPFDRIDPESCPFALPLACADKPAALAHMARYGVRALNLWSIPHRTLPGTGFPVAGRWRASVVGLPVHQGLRPRDLAVIAAAASGSP